MDFITQLFSENILHALGWTVLHSLWQAFIIALLLAAYLLGTKEQGARKRYIISCAAMGATLFFSLLTFFILLKNNEVAGILAVESTPAVGVAVGQPSATQFSNSFLSYFNENMPLIVTLWLLGMVVFLLKMLGGLLYIQQLKSRHLSVVPAQWQQLLLQLKNELSIHKTIHLAASTLVKVPMVVGWLKPVVLMPVAAVNNLDMQQVEAILAHELAHVARHDYLLNILQSVIEALFYFNPAVWWMSARIRTERENCCDDVAVTLCGNSIAYAKALVSLQEMQQARPALAMSFSKDKNKLLLRIQRILQSPAKKSNVMEKTSATLLLLAAIIMLSFQARAPFDNTLEETKIVSPSSNPLPGSAPLPEATPLPESESVVSPTLDTLPDGNLNFRYSTNGEKMEVKLKNRKITYLKINGEEVPESEYSAHEQMVEERLADTPPMPPMPEIPSFGIPVPPTPPTPPSHFFAPPPAPPAPPAKTRTITSERHGSNTTISIESTSGEAPIEIEFKNGKKGDVIINGKEIKGMKNGDRTVIVEKLASNEPNHFFHDQASGRTFWFPDNPEITGIPFPELPKGFELGALPEIYETPEWKALLEESILVLPDIKDSEYIISGENYLLNVPKAYWDEAERKSKLKFRDHNRRNRKLYRDYKNKGGRILQNENERKSLFKKLESEHQELLAIAEKQALLHDQSLLENNKLEELRLHQEHLERLANRMERLNRLNIFSNDRKAE